MHYYNRHIGDYAKDTGHLSLIEHGVYAVLLDWSYATERELPSSMTSIYRLCRAITAQEKRAVDSVVSEFFPEVEKKRLNKRVMVEICKFTGKSAKNTIAAKLSWESRRNANSCANAEQSQSNARARPLTKNQEPIDDEGALVGSDAEMIEFGRKYPGEIASGAPTMPDQWVLEFIRRVRGRAVPPGSWRNLMLASWRAEFRTWKQSGAGEISKKTREPWQAEKELKDVLSKIMAHPRNSWPGNKEMPSGVLAEYKALTELRDKLKAELK
jgi:uncharacterized protein YdaU (DUF1376 family)